MHEDYSCFWIFLSKAVVVPPFFFAGFMQKEESQNTCPTESHGEIQNTESHRENKKYRTTKSNLYSLWFSQKKRCGPLWKKNTGHREPRRKRRTTQKYRIQNNRLQLYFSVALKKTSVVLCGKKYWPQRATEKKENHRGNTKYRITKTNCISLWLSQKNAVVLCGKKNRATESHREKGEPRRNTTIKTQLYSLWLSQKNAVVRSGKKIGLLYTGKKLNAQLRCYN
ncbi:hypothetical protein BH10BAC3_BH10BAC3_05830 [soil metagenome]